MIVPMEQRHVQQVHQIEVECFSDPWSLKAFEEELKNPQAITLVAESSDKAVMGFVNVRYLFGECFINNVAVSAPYRNQGIASQLLQGLEQEIISQEGELITLEVRKSNFPAIRCYQKHGYQLVGERKNFYENPQENALLMTKFLTAPKERRTI